MSNLNNKENRTVVNNEFLFNVLIEKRINFEKSFENDYLINDLGIIITENKYVIDKDFVNYINNKGFKIHRFEKGLIKKEEFEALFAEVIEYDEVII